MEYEIVNLYVSFIITITVHLQSMIWPFLTSCVNKVLSVWYVKLKAVKKGKTGLLMEVLANPFMYALQSNIFPYFYRKQIFIFVIYHYLFIRAKIYFLQARCKKMVYLPFNLHVIFTSETFLFSSLYVLL